MLSLLGAAFEAMSEAMLLVGPDGCVVQANAEASRVFARDRDDLVGRSLASLARDGVDTEVSPLLTECGAHAMVTVRESAARADELDETRRLNRTLESRVESRTEELESANRALREREMMFRSITEAAQSAIVMIDNTGTTTFWNPAAERIFGWTEAEVLGRSVSEFLVPPHHRDAHDEGFEAFRHTSTGPFIGSVAELLALTKDGREIPIDMSLSAVEIGGKLGAVAILNDITARQRDTRALINARESAEQANRAKSAFLANMSHEIRTPMNAILGFSQLLRRDPRLAGALIDKVHGIERAGEHLLGLINEILEMAKIEAGHLERHPTTFDLHGLLSDIERTYRARIEARGLRFVIELDGRVPRLVRTDAGRLRQILVNLLDNAAKFAQFGMVALRTRLTDDDEICFDVQDTGPGIPHDEQAHIFDKFAQTRSGAQQGGTGLGLAISREYARLLGGQLRLTSDGQSGCVFSVELPLEIGAEADIDTRTPHLRVVGLELGQAATRILVADDEADNRAILLELLGQVGFEVDEATDGEQTVAKVRAWKPHVVLMDLRMPGLGGYEATRQIRALSSDTKVIAMSASTFGRDREEAASAGAVGFMMKPFKEHEVFQAIAHAIGVSYRVEQLGEGSSVATPAIALSDLAHLPDELRADMRVATVNGDLDGLLGLISCIEEADIAGALRNLARKYEYDQLLELLGIAP